MSKRIVLIWSPGNSGGGWMSKTFSSHENILIFQEVAHALVLSYAPRRIHPQVDIDYNRRVGQNIRDSYNFEKTTCLDIARGFLLDQFYKRKEDVIGLIKAFDKKTISMCNEICDSVKVVQTFRNPVGIVDFYTAYKMELYNYSEKESFEKTMKQVYKAFSAIVVSKEVAVRLEDLNSSLRNRTPFFKETVENIFEVKCSEEFIDSVRDLKDYGDDGSLSKEIWGKWDSWKKNSFLSRFQSIMEKLNYSYLLE